MPNQQTTQDHVPESIKKSILTSLNMTLIFLIFTFKPSRWISQLLTSDKVLQLIRKSSQDCPHTTIPMGNQF